MKDSSKTWLLAAAVVVSQSTISPAADGQSDQGQPKLQSYSSHERPYNSNLYGEVSVFGDAARSVLGCIRSEGISIADDANFIDRDVLGRIRVLAISTNANEPRIKGFFVAGKTREELDKRGFWDSLNSSNTLVSVGTYEYAEGNTSKTQFETGTSGAAQKYAKINGCVEKVPLGVSKVRPRNEGPGG